MAARPFPAIAAIRVALAMLALLSLGLTASAQEGGGPLFAFLNGLNTLSTSFTQTVTDAHGVQSEAGSGSLQVQRPNRFRWDYRPTAPSDSGNGAASGTVPSPDAGGDADTGQLMVADGNNLWFYDRELAQVTVKPIGAALSATPIMLLSGRLSELRASFQISSDGAKDGLDWVLVRPLSDQADFSDARLGFRGAELVRMVFQDKLGQSVQLDFLQAARNVPIDPTVFRFQVPPGVDVIGTPEH